MITEQQTKFIELRAKGFSLSSIATELHVSKRTLVNWGHKLEAEIQDLHAVEQEVLQEQILGLREHRLKRQGELLAQVEAELQKRSLADISTARLFSMAESLRKQIIKETSPRPRPQIGRESVPASPDIAPSSSGDRCNNGATSVQTPSHPTPQHSGREVQNHQQSTITYQPNEGAVAVQPERELDPISGIESLDMSEVSSMQDSQLKALSTNGSIQTPSGRERLVTSPEPVPAFPEDRCNNGATSPSDPDSSFAESPLDLVSKYLTNETEHEISDSAVGAIPDEPFIEVTLQDVMDKLPDHMRQRISQMRHPNELKRWLREHGGYVANLFKNAPK